MEIIRKGTRSILFNFFGAFLGFLLQFSAAKLFGTLEFGRWNYFLGVVNTLVLIFSFGVTFFFSKELNKTKKPNHLFSQIYLSFSAVFLISTPVLLYYITSIFQTSINPEIIIIFSFVLISTGYYRAYLIGSEKVDTANVKTYFFIRLLTLIIFLFFFYTATKTIHSIIYATLIANLIITIPFLIKTLKKVHLTTVLFKGSWAFYLIQLLYGFFNEYSKILQADYFSLKEVGYLSIALIIGQLLLTFGQNFANASMPTFAKAFREKNTKLLDFSFREVNRINALFVVPIFIFIFWNSRTLLSLIGDEYIHGVYMLKFILIGAFINSISGANGSLILMTNNEKIELGNGMLKIIVFLLAFFILGKNYVWGIAFSIAISEILVNILKTIEVYKIHRIVPFNKIEGAYVLKVLLFGASLHIALIHLMDDSIYRTLISMILCLILFFFSFHLSPNNNDRNFFYKVVWKRFN